MIDELNQKLVDIKLEVISTLVLVINGLDRVESKYDLSKANVELDRICSLVWVMDGLADYLLSVSKGRASTPPRSNILELTIDFLDINGSGIEEVSARSIRELVLTNHGRRLKGTHAEKELRDLMGNDPVDMLIKIDERQREEYD